MKTKVFLFVAASAALFAASNARAAGPSFNLVSPADTFSFDLLGFNTASSSGYFIAEGVPTFGVTSTYTGYDGNVVTVASSESIVGANTTDTFTVSTPTNFVTDTTINGLTITGIEFDLGNANSGAATTGTANPIDLSTAIGTYTATGSTVYGTSTKQALTPTTTLSNSSLSYAGVEAIQAGTAAINQYTVHSFTYSITYTNAVPEPSTYACAGAGVLLLGMATVRRNRWQTAA